MRIVPVLLSIALACTAAAQTTTGSEIGQLTQAWEGLQTQPQVELDLTGYQTLGTVTRYFQANVYWTVGTTVQVEIDDYDTSSGTPVPLHRYAADGRTLWVYDFVHQRYGGTPYGGSGSTQTDALALLGQLYTRVQGPASYMVRLLKEAFTPSGAATAQYTSWAPGYTVCTVQPNSTVQDPIIASRYYVSVGTSLWILYGPLNSKPTRSVAFNIDDSSGSYEVSAIDFADLGPNRLTTWTMNAEFSYTATGLGLPYSATAYAAYKPAITMGWQPIATVKLTG